MRPSETAELLALVQVYDNRTVDEITVAAWHQALADLRYDYTRRAVVAHFTASTEWLMPARVYELARHIARDDHPAVAALDGPELVPMPPEIREQMSRCFRSPDPAEAAHRRWWQGPRRRPPLDERQLQQARAEVAALAERQNATDTAGAT